MDIRDNPCDNKIESSHGRPRNVTEDFENNGAYNVSLEYLCTSVIIRVKAIWNHPMGCPRNVTEDVGFTLE